jgi:hypothetical protein
MLRDAGREHVTEHALRLGIRARILERRRVEAACGGAAPWPDDGKRDGHLPGEVLATRLALRPRALPAARKLGGDRECHALCVRQRARATARAPFPEQRAAPVETNHARRLVRHFPNQETHFLWAFFTRA